MELQLNGLRKRARMSRGRLAHELGVTESCVRSWEDGTQAITLASACEISLALACTLDELAGLDTLSDDGLDTRELLAEVRSLDAREKKMVAEAVRGMVASLHTLPAGPTISPPGVTAWVA